MVLSVMMVSMPVASAENEWYENFYNYEGATIYHPTFGFPVSLEEEKACEHLVTSGSGARPRLLSLAMTPGVVTTAPVASSRDTRPKTTFQAKSAQAGHAAQTPVPRAPAPPGPDDGREKGLAPQAPPWRRKLWSWRVILLR